MLLEQIKRMGITKNLSLVCSQIDARFLSNRPARKCSHDKKNDKLTNFISQITFNWSKTTPNEISIELGFCFHLFPFFQTLPKSSFLSDKMTKVAYSKNILIKF